MPAPMIAQKPIGEMASRMNKTDATSGIAKLQQIVRRAVSPGRGLYSINFAILLILSPPA